MAFTFFGKNIKYLRETKGMTQSDIANIIGCSDKAVSAWEKGIREPRMDAVQRLSDYFMINKSDLVYTNLSGVDEPLRQIEKKDEERSATNPLLKSRELAVILKVLTEEQQNKLAEIAYAVFKEEFEL